MITVNNLSGGIATAGLMTVTDPLPSGLVKVSISGMGWSFSGATCSRSDPLNPGASYPAITVVANVATDVQSPLTSSVNVALAGQPVASATLQSQVCALGAACPIVNPGGVVPVFSSATTIEPGSWISIYGIGLAVATETWNGDFPTLLGGVSVTIDQVPAYLWYVSPTQINLQVPNLQAPNGAVTGTVNVVVTTAGASASSIVNIGPYGPSFSLFNNKYAAAIVQTPSGDAGNSGQGYDNIGPTGAFSFPSRPVKAGEILDLYGVGFGPTTPAVPAGQALAAGTSAPSVVQPQITIGGIPAIVQFAGIIEAGLFQFNVIVPEVASGDQELQATVAGNSTPGNVFITVQ
jgi:uncharacterized protein (TIGR03437 family)